MSITFPDAEAGRSDQSPGRFSKLTRNMRLALEPLMRPAPWTRSISAHGAGSAGAPVPAHGSRRTSSGGSFPAGASPGSNLSTLWDGALPSGFSPMRRQGAIVGGSGGDCCKPGGGANLSAGYAPAGGGQQNAMIVGAPSNRCVDVAGANTGNGTDAIIGDCHGGANQPWNVNANGAITGVQSGRCLDANGAGTPPTARGSICGSAMVAATSSGAFAPDWILAPLAGMAAIFTSLYRDMERRCENVPLP
jgi:hypothetical protein